MAVVPICFKMSYKYHPLSTQNVIRPSERGFLCSFIAISEGSRFYSSVCRDRCGRWLGLSPAADALTKTKRKRVTSHLRSMSENASQRENLHMVWYASESSGNEKQLRLLDSYFGRLQGDGNRPSLDSSDEMTKLIDRSTQISAEDGLESLNLYLAKLNKDAENEENFASSSFGDETAESNPLAIPFSVSKDFRRGDEGRTYMELRNTSGESGSEGSQAFRQHDETSDLYLIGLLASINIAVSLFEIASPIRNSEFELFSLPLLYGAKINDLILVGEWWRLMTPMFLHSGLLHVALGCWALLTFGPQVCRVYGSLTFFLIYILGGISGNLTSFLHTPEPTVGGTGPVFAIIGAWLIYQIQYKDVIARDISDSMLQKAILITALSCILSNFGPIDDWTHSGAAFTGIIYGFFTCPALQLDDTSSRAGQEEGITLVKRYADPCKSLILFSIFILALCSLLFFIEPPLNALAPDEFV